MLKCFIVPLFELIVCQRMIDHSNQVIGMYKTTLHRLQMIVLDLTIEF